MSSNASSAFSTALPTPASSSFNTPTPSAPGTAAGSPSLTGSELPNVPNLAALPGEASSSQEATAPPDPNAPPAPADPNAPAAAPEKRQPATKRLRWVNPEIQYVLVSAEEFKALKKKQEPEYWCPPGSFRFFDLPAELRIHILQHFLCYDGTIDLDPTNYKTISPRLRLIEVSKRMHDEASQVFYGQNVFRLFPTHGRFFHTKKTLLQRLPKHYRQLLTTVEMRLGPGWSKPPKCWHLSPKVGLADCTSVRALNIFVEIDPSSDIFRGFRISGDFYTVFCSNLLTEFASQVPSLQAIEFDGWPSVEKSGELMSRLVQTAQAQRLLISWGKDRGWADECDLVESIAALHFTA